MLSPRERLILKLVTAIAHEEGFFLSEERAKVRGMRWPTRAQRHSNPGNIRRWQGIPSVDGYADFAAWARAKFPGEPERQKVEGIREGLRVLKVLVGQYVDGKYHGGKRPTLREFFEKWAPARDGNDPERYARHVGERTGLPLDVPLGDLAA